MNFFEKLRRELWEDVVETFAKGRGRKRGLRHTHRYTGEEKSKLVEFGMGTHKYPRECTKSDLDRFADFAGSIERSNAA